MPVLPQNTIFYDVGIQNKDYLYPMLPQADHVHAFQVPSKGKIQISIALTEINCEDFTLQGYFSDTILGQSLFPNLDYVNPFYVRKNYSYDTMYYASQSSNYVIYDDEYVFPKTNILSAEIVANNKIQAYISGPNPSAPSYTPVNEINDAVNRLILSSSKIYYVNLKNLQNKAKSYKLTFSNGSNANSSPPNECLKTVEESDTSNIYNKFRYPSQNRPSW